jgi:hypothetical protein
VKLTPPSTPTRARRLPGLHTFIGYVTRDLAAGQPGLTAPSRSSALGPRVRRRIAIEQGRHDTKASSDLRPPVRAIQLVPSRNRPGGLINLADDVMASSNPAVAVAASLHPSDSSRSFRPQDRRCRVRNLLGQRRPVPPPEGHVRGIVLQDIGAWDLPRATRKVSRGTE